MQVGTHVVLIRSDFENAVKDANGLHAAVLESLDSFKGAVPSRDDVTILVIEFLP